MSDPSQPQGETPAGYPPPGHPPGYPPPGYPTGYPPPGYPPPGYPGAASNGLSVAALVVGIVGLVFVWVPVAGAALPVAAVALGGAGTGRSRHTGTGRGMGIAGIVLGAVGVLLAVTVTALFLIFWPRISACDGPGMSPDERAQCLRDQFGLPSPAEPDGISLRQHPAQAVGPIWITPARPTIRSTYARVSGNGGGPE